LDQGASVGVLDINQDRFETLQNELSCHQTSGNRVSFVKADVSNRKQVATAFQSIIEEFGGFEPAKLMNSAEQYMWVDALIGQCLDGKRRGLEVIWELNDGTYVFDPETEELREE